MAVRAYIFVEATQGRAIDICGEIARVKGVVSAHAVTGPHDIIALVEADDVNELGEFIVSRIQNVAGVIRTMTNIVVE
ncbi:MAG: Lrp/AsnC ligand binding domain-containing protein [bacterium]|nr:Lrp/AsnC ligand binding domain-containing protein [bacterium]